MNKPHKSKMLAGLAGSALILLAGSAAAGLVVTSATQTSPSAFTPTWTVAPNSLIAGMAPSSQEGNFVSEGGEGGIGTSVLTDGALGPILSGGNFEAVFATAGNSGNAGHYVTYTLPAAANGFNLTNITVYSGWANGGRASQTYTVLYSTVANPGNFIWLTNVSVNYSGYGGGNAPNQPVSYQVALTDSAGAPIADNVAAVMFDFTTPSVINGANGYVGYSEITVQGTPAASVVSPVVSITTSNQTGTLPFTPSWTLETDSLIAGQTPTTTNGNFALELSTRDINSLTAGGSLTIDVTTGDQGDSIGNNTTSANYLTCGDGQSGGSPACSTIIYTLTNSVTGSDVTNIVVYNGWADHGRDGQYYTVSYSTVTAPTTYIPITTVYYLPDIPGGVASANRVAISTSTGGPLGRNVANIKFDFASPPYAANFNNGFQGYAQIIVEGVNSAPPTLPPSAYVLQDTLPTHAETVAGDQVVFTAAYSNAPPVNLQWQQVTGSATNNINAGVVTVTNGGVITSTLTLNNVQPTSSGAYRLEGLNATNSTAAPAFSTGASLTVGSTPAAVNNVIAEYAGQSGPTTFYPNWSVDTGSDLIFGSIIGANATAGGGNFGNQTGLNGDPTILTDSILSDSLANMVSCGWVNVGAGVSMTYTLPASANGYEITNIAVYGGWVDDGRNEQKYQVLYATTTSPTTFVPLVTVDYNPSFTSAEPNATRTTLIPVTGVLAHNVIAVEFNFNYQSKNNWNGYSEIAVGGTPSLGTLPAVTQDITPLTAEDVVGSSVTMTGGFSGATSYQWQKNGTNIAGATTPTLTLSNLKLTDTGAYVLLGINAAGANHTRACSVKVDPAPAPVGNVIEAVAYQSSDAGADAPFSPTWDTSALPNSLIYQQDPPAGGNGLGNFAGGGTDAAGGLPVLTDGSYGTFAYDESHPAFAACGPTAGQYVIYSLGSNANGYNVTNIQIAGGWNDNGRDSQYYTVFYSTVANPSTYIPLASVANNLSNYGANDPTVVRTTFTPAVGVLASNVAYIYVDFTTPTGVPNGYSGYSEISVFGSPSATDTVAAGGVTTTNENPVAGTSPDFVIETNSLIEGQLPSSVGPGQFAGSFNGEQPAGGLPVLTDGTFGTVDSSLSYATCGGAYGAGSSITYTAANGSWNITNIVVYSGWGNYDRDGQFYNITYSTLAAPTTFIPLISIDYNPPALTGPSANRVNIAPKNGATYLATNVYAVTFDFTPQTGNYDNGYSGYAEIVLQGSLQAQAIPPIIGSVVLSGGNLIVKGTGGTPGAGYTWLTTTNVLTPIAKWSVGATGTLDANGAFTSSIPVNSTNPPGFFRLRLP